VRGHVILCHDLPRPQASASDVALTYPALADRLARETGWQVVTEETVAGVGCLGTPAEVAELTGGAEALLARCRRTGVIRTPGFPASVEAWDKELSVMHPAEDAALLNGRPLLLVHGSDDPDVALSSARALAEAATGPSELHVVLGGGHWLRADPRVLALLVGWLERRH